MTTATKYTKTKEETLPIDASVSPTKSAEEKTYNQQPNTEASVTTREVLTPENDSEESQSDAFNPDTGEINWDCPCLEGMAKGSCGEQFKAAFSCFIYSKAEPKGVDCLEQFQKMKDCF